MITIYSNTLQLLIDSRIGFRSESFSGSGVRNVLDVLRFEFSLGNTDVIKFVQDNYDLLLDYTETGDELSDIVLENAQDIAEKIVFFLKEKFSVSSEDHLEALWLTSQEGVRFYTINEDIENEHIDIYVIPDEFVVLSDLGEEGSLFVFKTLAYRKLN